MNMEFNMCVNLYVRDVEKEVNFFTSIGFLEIERHKMEDSDTVVITPVVTPRHCSPYFFIWLFICIFDHLI